MVANVNISLFGVPSDVRQTAMINVQAKELKLFFQAELPYVHDYIKLSTDQW
jgi:hypothetical protein